MGATPVRGEEAVRAVCGDRYGPDFDLPWWRESRAVTAPSAAAAASRRPISGRYSLINQNDLDIMTGSQVSTTWRRETLTSSSRPFSTSAQ